MKIDPDLLRRRLKQGASYSSIAREMGCSRQAVHDYCRRHWLIDPPGRLKGVRKSWLVEQKKKGFTDDEIAVKLGATKSDVACLMRYHGLRGKRRRVVIDPDWLRKQKELGRTDVDIAAELGCSVTTVFYHRKKWGIEAR